MHIIEVIIILRLHDDNINEAHLHLTPVFLFSAQSKIPILVLAHGQYSPPILSSNATITHPKREAVYIFVTFLSLTLNKVKFYYIYRRLNHMLDSMAHNTTENPLRRLQKSVVRSTLIT